MPGEEETERVRRAYNVAHHCMAEVPVKQMQWSLIALLICVVVGLGTASGQTKPGPPGLQAAGQYEDTHPLEAPQGPVRKIDLDQIQQEADELSKLAQTIPADVRSTTQGLLSKDLLDKLKRIEKLSKHLRSEVSP